MAIDFPDSPSNNDIYTVNGKRWIYSSGKWSIYGPTAPDATASDTEPTGVGDGHIWYRSDQSQTLIRYDNTWVEVGSAGGFDSSSTSFPTSLDSATGFAAVEALQAKVGVDSSAVTTSLDYKVAQKYDADTILGTVSQSGGTPTGAVIERGSNANGEFVKFADGTMICQMFIENFDFNTTGGSDLTHPATFVNRFPVRFASIVDASTAGVNANEGIALLGLTGTDTNSRLTVTTAKSDTRDIGVTVIGRWF